MDLANRSFWHLRRGIPKYGIFFSAVLLAQLEGSVCGKKNEHLRTLIKRARANLRACIAQNEKRLTFPELFAPIIPPPRSPIYWDKSFPKTSLMSLVVALDSTKVCADTHGNQAPFIAVVHTFEAAFNINFPNPYKMRDELLCQGDNRTKFIRQLLRALGSE